MSGEGQVGDGLSRASRYGLYIIKLMPESKFQTKHLQDIAYNKPNFLTGVRFLMNYVAVWLFPNHPQSAGLVMMISVILDYFDGKVARKYNQCTFVGEMFDWITDIFNYIICLFWWYQLEPELLSLMGTLLCLEIVTMMVDIISKCYGYHPKLNTDRWVTYILKFTMNVGQRGYTSIGLGYWNTILHWLCIVARVLSLATPYYKLWNYVFLICLPGSISYVWMHLGYTLNILDRWNQEFQKEEIRLKFIEK